MGGTSGATRPSNTKLVEYGIQNDNSHVRAHVCPTVRRVYVYPTKEGISAIETGAFRCVYGHQPGIDTPTAKGYLVPPFSIRKCVSLQVSDAVWESLAFNEQDGLGEKGQKAVRMVLGMLRNGLFPIPAIGANINDLGLQITGTDILIDRTAIGKFDVHVQVKCDFPGGEASLGGTGYLFLQIEECNPFGIH